MKILHTSDWHLGRRLHGESLTESQERFLGWLHSEVLADTKPDLLVIAGDIYDRGVPPTDAMELLEDSLLEIQRRGIPVLITSGNHDSRVRLGTHSRFMAGVGLHYKTRLTDITVPVQIDAEDFTLLAYGIPYLEPDVDAGLADHQWNVEASQASVLAEAMLRINVDVEARAARSSKPVRTLVASHAFVQGASPSDSERNIKDIKVGGLGQTSAGVFAGVDYVALGHIHRPHTSGEIKGPGTTLLRYSGSPIPFSFSERSDSKQVLLVEFSKDGVKDAAISSIMTPQIRGMQQIEGTLQEILSDQFQESGDWIKIILKDKDIPINVFETIKRKYKHLLDLDHRTAFVGDGPQGRGEILLQNLTPEEVTRRFVERVTKESVTDDVATAIESCCAEVRVALSQVNK